MVGALQEGEACDDLRRAVGFEFVPPWRTARYRRDQRQIALGFRNRLDRCRPAEVRDIGHDKAEMKPR